MSRPRKEQEKGRKWEEEEESARLMKMTVVTRGGICFEMKRRWRNLRGKAKVSLLLCWISSGKLRQSSRSPHPRTEGEHSELLEGIVAGE